jgi:hypothetical protein
MAPEAESSNSALTITNFFIFHLRWFPELIRDEILRV